MRVIYVLVVERGLHSGHNEEESAAYVVHEQDDPLAAAVLQRSLLEVMSDGQNGDYHGQKRTSEDQKCKSRGHCEDCPRVEFGPGPMPGVPSSEPRKPSVSELIVLSEPACPRPGVFYSDNSNYRLYCKVDAYRPKPLHL